MSDDTRAALDAAIKAHDEAAQAEGAALALHRLPTGDDGTYAAYTRAVEATEDAWSALDAAITAHVEAEIARRLAAAPEVEAAIGDFDDACSSLMRQRCEDTPADAREPAAWDESLLEVYRERKSSLIAAIAADKARSVAAAHAEADQLSHFVNDVIRRVGARERGAGGQTVDAGTARLLADAGRRIDAMVARDQSRPTPDEARRLVDAYGSAVDKLAGLGYMDRPSKMLVDDLITKHNAARTALLRALGVEA